MFKELLEYWRLKTQSRTWEDVRKEIEEAFGDMKVRFEITPYYYKVISGQGTWYWNKDTGEFDGTSYQVTD
ncbi:hypothetical protein LCGC14_1965160 [marine sediment metagenome]|uniref:Uncharacterized protein n=1 Tax=marine sediment metagenome TaxID=412755 RepID=A0A0F9HRU8_9ZZZZ